MAVFTHAPKSEHIKNVSYDDRTNVLSVTFQHDRQPEPKAYRHAGVPIAVFNSYLRWMKQGQSAGGYYSRFVKRYRLVAENEKAGRLQ